MTKCNEKVFNRPFIHIACRRFFSSSSFFCYTIFSLNRTNGCLFIHINCLYPKNIDLFQLSHFRAIYFQPEKLVFILNLFGWFHLILKFFPMEKGQNSGPKSTNLMFRPKTACAIERNEFEKMGGKNKAAFSVHMNNE